MEFPLQSEKSIGFYLWLKIINLLNDKKHLITEGIMQIITLKSIMNLGLSTIKDKFKLEFPNLEGLKRQEYEPLKNKLNPNWITGFIEGDGSFYIVINKKVKHVAPFLSIGLDAREKLLVKKIQSYFEGKGKIYLHTPANRIKEVVEWKVYNVSDLITISSHFSLYSLMGKVKSKKFVIWKEILHLVENKTYLTEKGLSEIKSLNNKIKDLN